MESIMIIAMTGILGCFGLVWLFVGLLLAVIGAIGAIGSFATGLDETARSGSMVACIIGIVMIVALFLIRIL